MSKSLIIVSIIAGVFVGLLLTAQVLTKAPINSSYPLDQVKAQKDLVESFTEEENFLKSRILSLREKIDKNIEQNQTLSQTANIGKLNELKKIIGLAEISGEGFTIELDDSPFIDRENINAEEEGLIYASDIRDIVNLLRTHNVEGLAINDQRIIATSSISSVGNTLLINNSNLAPPFTIKTIGDYDSFLIRLKDPAVLTDFQERVKINGVQFAVTKAPYLVLPIYNGQLRLKFMTVNYGL